MCFFFSLLLLGPRFVIFMWWLFDADRWEHAFDGWFFPLIGFLIFPWLTLMFVAVSPTGNVEGWDWFWLGLAGLADLASIGGSGYGNRQRMPGYS